MPTPLLSPTSAGACCPATPGKARRWLRYLPGLALLGVLGSHTAQAQTVRTLPGDYASLAAAITDLNTNGVPAGGVTINVAAGYTETAAGLLLTATGTSTSPIVIQKAGTGANPRLTAGTGTSTTLDFVLGLSGSDFVTIDGLDVAENAANTTATTQMEYGYALFRPSATDGAQNNILRNCVVTLTKTNVNTIGIAGVAGTAASVTAVAATSPAGANSNNVVQSCVVSNANIGINFAAASATSAANFDQNNLVGAAAGGSTGGNTVGNFGSLTQSGWGIGGSQQNGLRIAGNTINSTLNYTSASSSTPVPASTVTTTLRGIFGNAGTSGSVDIVGNTITLASGATTSLLAGIENSIGSTAAANTVTITGNTITNCTYATATTGAFTGIVNSATAATVNLSGNTVSNNVTPGTGTMTLISNSAVLGAQNLTINNNTVTGNSKTPSGATTGTSLLCITVGTASTTMTGNVITNNSIVTSGTSSSSCTLVGLNSTAASTPVETLTNNTITGLSISGTTTSTASLLRGILTSSASSSNVQTLTGNVIGNLSIATGSGTVTGISIPNGGGTGTQVSRNKIYNLSAVGAGGSVTGLLISTGGTYTVANNLIGDLRTPDATGLVAINGVQVSGGTAVNAYYNTIWLNAQSTGATFGTTGIYLNSTTATLDLRNNLVVNKSTANGTGGLTVALRRVSGTAGTAPSNLAATTNNNLYFAGTPSATNLIYGEGSATLTNAQPTLAAYKAFLVTREGASVTEDATFLSTAGPDATFLHLSPTVPTQAESGGSPVAGITVDFDGDTRNTSTPDIGADEGSFTPLDLTGPSISFSPLTFTTSTTSRTLSVTITDPSGVATGANAPRLFYRKGTSGAFASAVATSVSGSTYTFTFDYAAVGGVVPGDVIQYYVVAQDVVGNVSSNPAGGTFAANPATVFQYSIAPILSGTYYVGSGASPDPARTYATLTAAASAYNNSGLGGPVTMLLLDASYGPNETFPIVLVPNADASATNTLTIKPAAGVTTTLSGSSTVALLALNGADYITLDGSNGGTISATDARPSRNWTVNNTSTATTANGILVTVPTSGTETANFNTVQNLVVTGGGSTTAQIGIFLNTATTNTAGNTGNVVRNNLISNSVFGIYTTGVSATIKSTGTVITQNDLNVTGTTAIGRYGITALFEDGIQVTQNTIDGIASTASADVYGISLGFASYLNGTFTGSEVTNATVSRNYVGGVRQTNTYSAIGIGLAAATSGTSTISNNMVAGVLANGTASDFAAGIFVGGGTGSTTRVVFNSVNMTGTLPTGASSGSQVSYALAVGGSTPTVEIRNNVLANTAASGATGALSTASVALGLAYSSTAGAYVGLTSSNNNFFVGTGSTFAVGRTGGLSASAGTLRASLADWNAETGQDNPTTSKVADPQFVSATDLHSASPALNNAGTPVAGISVDFDGQTRSTTTPDIGADEFTLLDVAATALSGPTAGAGCYSAAEAVSVTIRNNATGTLDFAATPATVTVTVTGGATPQTSTATVNTGTLAAGATLVVAVGTVDLSAAATYALTASVTVAGDENAANNALATPLTIVSTPRTAAFTYPSGAICAGSAGTVVATLATGAASGGTFSSTAGLTVDPATGAITPSTSTPGTYTVTYSLAAAGACPALTATQTVTVSPATSAAFSYAGGTFCVSGTNPVATVTGTAGGTFSSTAGLTINATTGAINLAASTPGTYTVTYTVSGTCGSSSTQQVTITTAPLASFSYPSGTYCAGTTGTVAPSFGTGASGGTFSSTTGLTINATTGIVNLSTSTAGTYTITNTIAASGGCAAATATATLTINPAASAAFSYAAATFCQSGTNPVATVTGTAGGTFSSTAGLSLNASTGAINLTASTPGTYTVTYTAGTNCPATATATVTITAPATAGFSYAATSFCASQSTAAAATLATGATAGTFSSTVGLTINATTGAITPSTSTPGTYTVTNTVAAAGGCAAVTSTATVTITAAPVATFSYANAAYCAGTTGTAAPVLGTGASAGTFSASGTGLVLNATTGAINLSTSTPGTYTVTNTIAAAGGCAAATATFAVTINARPATPTVSVAYNGTTTTLTSSAATGNQWLLNGAPVPGATGQTYVVNTPAQFGSYTVVATNATTGCVSLPSTPLIVSSSLKPLAGATLSVFPNPTTTGELTLELTGYSKATELTVFNALGQRVLTTSLPGKAGLQRTELDLTRLPAGVYLLHARTEGGLDVRRIVKQ